MKEMNETILPHPPGSGWMRQCPSCGRRFSLNPATESTDDLRRLVRVLECRRCGRRIEFADRHPPGAL